MHFFSFCIITQNKNACQWAISAFLIVFCRKITNWYLCARRTPLLRRVASSESWNIYFKGLQGALNPHVRQHQIEIEKHLTHVGTNRKRLARVRSWTKRIQGLWTLMRAKVYIKRRVSSAHRTGKAVPCLAGSESWSMNDKRKDRVIDTVFSFMVHLQGLEPGTHWLRVSCSTNWAKGANGSPCWAWTNDPMINSHVLYRLS